MELELTFSMIAKLVSADGAVSSTEIKVVERLIDEVLKLDINQKNRAIEIFNTAKKSKNTFASYAEKYKKIYSDNPEMLSWILDLLVKLSYADKQITDNEIALLNQASKIFDLPLAKYKKFFGKKNIEPELKVLGCGPSDSPEQITLKYNQLCELYSPQKIENLGLPVEFIELAESKIEQFANAYSEIKCQLKF